MKFKEMYIEMEISGELYEIFEEMTGVWKTDRVYFIKQQKDLESLGNTIEVYE